MPILENNQSELEQLLFDFIRRVSADTAATAAELEALPRIAAVLLDSIR